MKNKTKKYFIPTGCAMNDRGLYDFYGLFCSKSETRRQDNKKKTTARPKNVSPLRFFTYVLHIMRKTHPPLISTYTLIRDLRVPLQKITDAIMFHVSRISAVGCDHR